MSIRENGGVETIHNFGDEARSLKLFEDFLLATMVINNLVKLVILSGAVVLLEQGNLIVFFVHFQEICVVTSFAFMI